MKSFATIIKSDYLQRTRSYAFLITLCVSLAIAYTFVPEPNANYSTIRVAGHVGYYNSAWFGYVTAIMTSIFLSLIGFYLVNSGIKKDIETKVGEIVSSTPISNFRYLLAKTCSNFLILSTIVLIVFAMSILLFILYNEGYSFQLFQFVTPYLLIAIPTMFLIAVIAVVFEVFLGKFSALQNVSFFFLFSALMVFKPSTPNEFSLDFTGTKIVINQLEETVKTITKAEANSDMSIGYIINSTSPAKKFLFNGMDFPNLFIISRLGWILLGILIIMTISPLFHRFNVRERKRSRKTDVVLEKSTNIKEIVLPKLPKAKINYSIYPLIKTEFQLLFRKGKKWLWAVNIIGMVLLALLPLKISHQMVLPILWFLQVSRLSDLGNKETTNNVHYFAFASYRPLGRLLVSQVIAGVMLMLFLASPLILRMGILADFLGMIGIISGGVFLVLCALFLGIVSKGKKLFEVLFFMVTYANINGIIFLDYFGAFEHDKTYLVQLSVLNLLLVTAGFLVQKFQLAK